MKFRVEATVTYEVVRREVYVIAGRDESEILEKIHTHPETLNIIKADFVSESIVQVDVDDLEPL